MIEYLRANAEVSTALVAGVIALMTAVFYALSKIIRQIPKIIEARLDERLEQMELARDEFTARAMRDRAIADAIVHAASVNAQAMHIIKLQAEMLRSETPLAFVDEMTSANLMLRSIQIQLKETIDRLRLNERKNANSDDNTNGTRNDTRKYNTPDTQQE